MRTALVYKLLIADDHAVVRKGIIQILQGHPDLVVDGEVASGPELLDRVQDQQWDGVIMDLNMPGTNGLDVLKHLRATHPELPILVLSMHPEDQYATRMLRAGASGYLTKESVPDQLVHAIRQVCAGGTYLSPTLRGQTAVADGAHPACAPHELLSDREFQVLRMLATGMTPTQIAAALELSVKTVTTYRARMLDKMHMESSAELMRYAIKAGLVD
jgi:two-component system, NarL family, invasion response regulator UvrY